VEQAGSPGPGFIGFTDSWVSTVSRETVETLILVVYPKIPSPRPPGERLYRRDHKNQLKVRVYSGLFPLGPVRNMACLSGAWANSWSSAALGVLGHKQGIN